MTNELETPFPEVQIASQDKSIREQFLELQAREAREAEAALNAKLDGIADSGLGASVLKSDMGLRIKFVERHGWQKFSELNQAHLRREHQQKLAAELAEKNAKWNISTTQGRIDSLNKARKATAAN